MFDPTGAVQGRPQEWRTLVPNVVSYSRCSILLEPFKADLKSGECWFQMLCLIPDVRSYWSHSRLTSRVANVGSKCCVLLQMFDPTGAVQGRPQERRMLVPSVVSYSRCSILLEPFKADLKSGECWFQVLSRMRQLLLEAYSKCVSRFEDHMRAERERRTQPGWSFNSYFMLQVRHICPITCVTVARFEFANGLSFLTRFNKIAIQGTPQMAVD